MKVQTRLTLFTTSIFGIVFLLSSLFIYAFYAKSAKERVYQDLDKNAYLTAFFYLEEDELNKHEYSKVKNQFNEYVTNSFYQVYDFLCYTAVCVIEKKAGCDFPSYAL